MKSIEFYLRSRYPLEKITATVREQVKKKIVIEIIEIRIGISDAPKKLQRNPLTIYKTGFSLDTNCQYGLNIWTL